MTLYMHQVPPASQHLAQPLHQLANTERAQLKQVGIVNLMPDKATTERQWLHLLNRSGWDIQVTLLGLQDWQPRNTSAAYLQRYYRPWQPLSTASQPLDGIIITGAPLGQVAYDNVLYWQELTQLFTQLERISKRTLFSCWSANAALHALYQIDTERRPTKLFGLYTHQVAPAPLTQDIASPCIMPHSRYGYPCASQLGQQRALQVLWDHADTGPTLFTDTASTFSFVLAHPEYEADTLAQEFQRDQQKGMATAMPVNYFANQQRSQLPKPSWQLTGAQLLRNWLTEGA